jgi:transaldolase
VLEDEGVEKFVASWHELQGTVAKALEAGTAEAAQ